MAAARKLLRVALVGTGRMGAIRAEALAAHPRVDFAHIVDSDTVAAGRMADTYGSKAWGGLDELLAAEAGGVDAILVSTPSFTHLSVIEAAASAGKAIMVEKPVCEEPDDIKTAFAAARAGGVPLFCSFQRRFDPSMRRCLEAVKAGRVGQVQMINCAFRDHPVPPIEFLVTGGDPFTDLMPHDVDFVRTLLGEEPCEVFAMGSAFQEELAAVGVLDTAMAMLRFPSGTMVKIDMTRSSPYGYDQRVEVFGSRGMLEVGNLREDTVELSTAEGATVAPPTYSFPQRYVDAYRNEVGHFVEVALDGVEPVVTETDCIQTQLISQAALRSYKEGKPVAL